MKQDYLCRILNRFSKEIDVVDNQIPMNVRMMFTTRLIFCCYCQFPETKSDDYHRQCWYNIHNINIFSLNVAGTIFTIVFAMPLFIAVILPLAVVYYFVQKIYVATARQVISNHHRCHPAAWYRCRHQDIDIIHRT